VKRAADLLGAGLALVILSPVLVVVAVVVRWTAGRPVLFGQERAGRNGRPFTVWKFRTMTDARDEAGRPRPDGERLTGTGRWLRSSSLDELPELWNVIRGDMSLIGPRPLPVVYLPRYSTSEARRHELRPGITGWAQVNGRNAVDWDRRLAMDVWYVDHRSLLLDVRILAKTVVAVVTREGVSGAGTETMTELRPHLSEHTGRPER
jgi:lipopolysaccharide/colanic/teichoic acid biosynthesis glycosyltransferase